MAGRSKDIIRVEYHGFYIHYDDEKNIWKSKDSLDQEVSAPSLNAIKALLLKKQRSNFEPVKMWHNHHTKGWEVVEVYAINPQEKVFYKRGNEKDSWPFSTHSWGGKIDYNFFAFVPENNFKAAKVNALNRDIEDIQKEIGKIEASMIPAKIPKR